MCVSDERGACHCCNHDQDCDQQRCPHVATTVLDLDGMLSGLGSTENWGLELTKFQASGNT